MAAFFGIDERKAQGFIDHHVVCIPRTEDGALDVHAIVAPLRNEDIVFIKRNTPGMTPSIKAVGVVQSDYPVAGAGEVCLPVDWVWQGEKVPDNPDEIEPLCGEAFYEEHNILVQREIIDLLPGKYRMGPEW
jgi:hypothetical protein